VKGVLFALTSVLAVSISVRAADVYVEKAPPHKPCPLRGNAPAKSKLKMNENFLKNRWNVPTAADFDNTVTAEALVKPGDDRSRWDARRAARIRGYVAVVVLGTRGESCNCGAKAPIDTDTHIALVADKSTAQDKRTYVILEITPRIRENLAAQIPAIDWSTDALKKRLPGKRVEFEGWLFFDAAHVGEATNTHPNDPKNANWRATCWEIHPVTSLRVIGTL
jgi:hypothetical protein